MEDVQTGSKMVAQYSLPYGMKHAGPVYMIKPSMLFRAAWNDTAPEQASLDYIRRNADVIKAIKKTLSTEPDFKQAIPHIGIDVVDGKPEVSFIDGVRRFEALRQLGEEAIPALVDTNIHDLDKVISFVRPVPPEILAQLYGDGQSAWDTDAKIIAEKIEWAKTKEGEEALLKWFQAKGLGAIAGECLEYYQQHGNTPPAAEIERMKVVAKEKLCEALKTQGREAITDAYFEYHQKRGKPPTEKEVETMVADAKREKLLFRTSSVSRYPSLERGGRGGGIGGR